MSFSPHALNWLTLSEEQRDRERRFARALDRQLADARPGEDIVLTVEQAKALVSLALSVVLEALATLNGRLMLDV
jgi:hypothetical protein